MLDPLPTCRIGHLTAVAGPKGVGKSTLIRRLLDGENLGPDVSVPSDAHVWTGRKFRRKAESGVFDHVVMHYDILRPFGRGENGYRGDPATSVFACADRITFLTLRTTHERLCAQLARRLQETQDQSKRDGLRRIRALYDEEQFLAEWYDRWLRYVARRSNANDSSYFVDVHESYALTRVAPRRRRPSFGFRLQPLPRAAGFGL